MSQMRLIYPLLDGYLLGDAISEHDGVRCYPAIQQKTGEKFIVKVVSIPASRVQLDALLLTGAFSGKDSALRYFKELAKDKANEAQILQQLSQQEGFVAYQDSQIVSSQDGNGYEVYLLGTFKKSLEKVFAANDMTHRNVVELGLDLCAALAACRRAGYLYVDLKPSNVFYTEETGYRIGDVGFASLSSLQFTPLQNAYRSRYTAPEMADDFAVINTTLDIYAMGLVLYQACNGGVLPEDGNISIPPLYADYELAKIIAKACSENVADRYQEPTQVAQALIGYMQQVGVSDDPLIPVPQEDEPADVEEFLPEATEEELAEEIAQLPPEDALMEVLESAATLEAADSDAEAEDISQILAHADDLIAHPLPDPVVAPEPIEVPIPESIVMEPESKPEQEPEPEPEPKTEPETEPAAESEPIVEPEPESKDVLEATASLPEKQTEVSPHTESEEPKVRRSFPWKALLGILLAALLLVGCYQVREYYNNVYLQNVDDLIITLEDNSIHVKVVSSIDESLLRVYCTDSYGNSQQSAVTAGIAIFENLQPQTRYAIRVQISGNHKLTGKTTDSITTPEQTNITTFTACIGDEDGSALLTLTTSGPEVEIWTLTYFADGVDAITTTFTGNQVIVRNLQVGKDYTFLLSAENQRIGGTTQINYTATNIILAQDLAITACGGGSLQVQWVSPEGYIPINGWSVRCYDGAGYDQTVITYEPHFTFKGMDHSTECTVEVTAVGMYQSVSVTIGANPITIENIDFSVSMDGALTVQWEYSGNAPEGGWIVDYTIDGHPNSLTAETNTIRVASLPGAVYNFTIRAASEVAVFGGNAEFSLTEVGAFIGYGVSAEGLLATYSEAQLILTASEEVLVEASEDSVSILYILRTNEGLLHNVAETEIVWDAMWENNSCTLTVPNVPSDPGTYRLSVYFNGGWVCDVTFFVE